jgi:putative oxidoreductase
MNACCEKLRPYAPLFLRIGLGIIFTYHGYGKVFGDGTALGTAWNAPEMPVIIQALVAWGEFIGGIAIILGFLTELAAVGIIIIMIGAIVTVHGKNGFSLMNGGFEYNFALIMMCLTLIATGPGPVKLFGCPCCKRE